MANVTVTASTSNVNVNSTTNEVLVTTTTSNVVVGAATSVNIDETLVDLGSVSGNITLDLNLGRTFKALQTGNVTYIDVSNLESGRSATFLIQQDGNGGHFLDVTNPAWAQNWEFANDFTDIARNANNWNVISFFYDGLKIYASLVVSEALGITNNDLANSNIIINNPSTTTNATFELGSNTTFTADLITDGSSQQAFKKTANNITTANVTANYFLGNGSQLTGLTGIGLSNLSVTQASASGTGTLAYNNGTGVFTYTPPVLTSFINLTDLSVTQASASGTGTLAYNSGSGVFTYTPPDLTGTSLTNAQVVSHIATVPLAVGGNLSVTGNIDATGNINYQNVTDLFVRDQSITLNANATTDATVEIISNRPQSTHNAIISWNEPAEKWTFMNGDNVYQDILTTSQTRGLISTATPATPSGGGALAYNSTTGAFTFTPAVPGIALTALSMATPATPSGGGALAYNNSSGEFTFTPAVPGIALSALSTSTATPSSGGALAYDNSSGVFTFTPAVPGIALTNLSVTQASASGTGALAYNNSTGVFTYTPPVLTTGDIEGVTAGVGLSGGGTTGTVTLNLDPTITTAGASGSGALAYDNSSGVFTFTPADAVTTATNATNIAITDDTSTDATHYITYSPGPSGNNGIKVSSSKLFFNPNTGATNITGLLSSGGLASTGNISTTTHVDTPTIKNTTGATLTVGDADNIIISAGSDGVTQKQTFLGTNETVLQTDSVGYAPFVFNQLNPVNGGQGARQNELNGAASSNAQPLIGFVANATVTAGSTTVTLTSIAKMASYFAGSENNSTLTSDAATMATIMGDLAVNSVPKTGGLFQMTQAPFAKGTYITAVDTSAKTITLSEAATASTTLTTLTGSSAAGQNALWMSAGAFNTEVKYAEMYVSYADRVGNPVDANYYPLYSITVSLDQFGADKNGFSTSDLTYTTNNPGSWTAAGYTTSGKTLLSVPDGAVSSPYGLTLGNSTATSYKSFNDISGATFGLNVGWDGLESSTVYGGTGTAIPQIGLASFTDNTFQSSVISNGPRFIYQSRKGNVNNSELDQFPRSGQELGRTVFWGTHGDNPAPSTTAAPGYISFAAADDWTDGSNTNAYFVATSNYTDATSREPFLSFEKGELIIASGQPTSVQADIRFAPAVKTSSNPQNVYDFSSDAAAAGSKGWASINYANITATSGAEVSVNNGMSLGAGTVGDMKVTIHRKDNTYALANTDVVVDEFYTGGTNSAATGGAQVCDLVGVAGGVITSTTDRYTFSGITDSNWTYLNGNTYTFASSLFGGSFRQLKNVDGSNVVQGGADRGVAQPSIGQSFVIGVVYRIVSVGTTDFTAIGAANNNIGTTFTASGTGSGSGIGSRILTGQYTFANSQASGVTDKKWEFGLQEQSENLTLKGNTTTQVTFTDARTEFGSSLHLKDYTTTEINALASPLVGDVVYNTTLNQICFYNGTAWQKITSTNM